MISTASTTPGAPITQQLRVKFKTDCKPILQRKGKYMATENKLKKVFICSPFRGFGDSEEERTRDCKRNIHNARAACNFAVMNGCVPYAPHLYFPQFLKDADSDERKAGLLMGLIWLSHCDELWVIGRRISEGMENEINMAKDWGIPIVRYVEKRSPEERLLDAIFYPDIEFHEMVIPHGTKDMKDMKDMKNMKRENMMRENGE